MSRVRSVALPILAIVASACATTPPAEKTLAQTFAEERGEACRYGDAVQTSRRLPVAPGASAPIRIAEPLSAPSWRPGDEWSVHRTHASGSSAGTLSLDREETVDGVECYVVGSRRLRQRVETFFRKEDLAQYMTRVDGALEERFTPPLKLSQWPLAPGMRWEQQVVPEQPREPEPRRQLTVRCEVAAGGAVTVVAGSFPTLKVTCRNRAGDVTAERWYAPAVRSWVKDRVRVRGTMQERELIAFRSG